MRPRAAWLVVALLLGEAAAWADHPAGIKHWLADRPRLEDRLERSLGGPAQRKAFVDEVSRAVVETRIGKESGRWLLEFAARLGSAESAQGLDPRRVLRQLERARGIGAKTGVARELRRYADLYLEHGVVRSQPDDDPRFVAQARALRARVGRARREGAVALPPLVIGLDGPDGAGKSSSRMRLAWALRGLGYRVLDRVPHLLKPAAGQSYVDYFKGEVGALPGRGEVMFLDRTMLGQIAYGHDEASAREAMGYLTDSLRPARGEVLIFAAHLPRERAAKTYGKRLARELFVDDPTVPRVSDRDVPAFRQRGQLNRAFAAAASVFPENAHLVDLGERDAARREMLRVVGRTILSSIRARTDGVRPRPRRSTWSTSRSSTGPATRGHASFARAASF